MPKFKEGDRVRFIQDDNWGHKKGSIGTIKEVSSYEATGDNSHWGHCVYLNEFSSGSYEGFLELVPLTLAEQLEAAKAEVARIEAEIAEATMPKVGDRLIQKGRSRVTCTVTYELLAIIPYRLGEAYVTQCYKNSDDRDIPIVSSPDLWEKF